MLADGAHQRHLRSRKRLLAVKTQVLEIPQIGQVRARARRTDVTGALQCGAL